MLIKKSGRYLREGEGGEDKAEMVLWELSPIFLKMSFSINNHSDYCV